MVGRKIWNSSLNFTKLMAMTGAGTLEIFSKSK
jgi:hypothetical protein